MKFLLLLYLTTLLSAGTVTGKIDLSSIPKPPPVAQRYAGQGGGEKADPSPPNVAVVYLESDSIPEDLRKPPAEPVNFAQRGLQFVPNVLPVIVGTKVRFPNEDDVHHNVFSYSPIKKFDLGRYARNEEPPIETFDTPGVVKIFCEVHSHMRGTIVVVRTPYFVRTDAEGNFRLEGIPPGKYQLTAVLTDKKQFRREVEIGEQPLDLGWLDH